tara:strand:- start:438 stop:851 length:414 start_codon:yes stop_codon:yes gene_type:complete
MEKIIILCPTILMMVLTLLLYVKNYLDNIEATKSKAIKFSYFKAYQDEVPEYVAVSRQTLKNQFELPIFFYFLISLILIFDVVSITDVILAWIFVISRYLHCYIRLTSNYVPNRAKVFMLGLFVLVISWINFLSNIY